MRIGFDAGPAFSLYSGIGQYVRSLFSAMVPMAPDIEWVGYVPSGCSTEISLFRDHSSIHPGYPRSSWNLGGVVRKETAIDLFHGTNFNAPSYDRQQSVLTIHDLWLARNPQYSKKFFGQGLSSWKLSRRAKRMAKIIAVSKFSAHEIHEVLGVPLERIAVIYHGCSFDLYADRDEGKFQEMSRRFNLFSLPYILFVGGAEPRKNHRTLFQAFSQSPSLKKRFSLVAVGDRESRGDNLFRTAREYGISDRVCCPGLVNAEDLRTLYAFATVFVFPSLYEGFGIPVVAANRTALPEIGGEAALYVDPVNSENLRYELEYLLTDEEAQSQLRAKGLQHVKQFTWDRAAHETLSLYREVMS